MVRGVNNVTNSLIADPSQFLDNVYHVNAFNGPYIADVKLILNHCDYHSWTRSMRQALDGNHKFDFVDELITIVIEFDPNFKAHNCCNMLVHSWIVNSVDESITQSIVFLENAIDV